MLEKIKEVAEVAIPSNRVNVSYGLSLEDLEKMIKVAIPSNRVNVSYKER